MGWPDAFAIVGVALAIAWIYVSLFRAVSSDHHEQERHDYESSETTTTQAPRPPGQEDA